MAVTSVLYCFHHEVVFDGVRPLTAGGVSDTAFCDVRLLFHNGSLRKLLCAVRAVPSSRVRATHPLMFVFS